MSVLALTKNYADSTLLFASDLHGMWTELETKSNGGIDNDNIVAGWASFSNVTLLKDTAFTIGLTASAHIKYDNATSKLIFSHITTAKSFLFKIGGTIVMEADVSGNVSLTKDVFFYFRSITYPLSYLIGYQKPVLVFSDTNTVYVEQNTTTANRSLIVFPNGPCAVTEDIVATNKFRMLKLDAVANGYLATHTGAADSGIKAGLTLASNTWYFVYAAIVRGGADVNNSNWILVVDSINPMPANWVTHDTTYGSGNWVYLGTLRYGYGTTLDLELVPFIMDHTGWTQYTSRAATDNFFGVKLAEVSVSSTVLSTMLTMTKANSGNGAPANISHMKLAVRPIAAGAQIAGNFGVYDGTDLLLWRLPSFAQNLTTLEAHGWDFKVPNLATLKIKGLTG